MAIESKKTKIDSRTRNKFRIRKVVSGSPERPRLTVFRSGKHTYAQLISDTDGKTILSASTIEAEVKQAIDKVADTVAKDSEKAQEGDDAKAGVTFGKSKSSKSVIAAYAVGSVLGQRAVSKSITKVVFDRNGRVYQGRVRAVAEGARSGGLNF